MGDLNFPKGLKDTTFNISYQVDHNGVQYDGNSIFKS